MCPLTAASKAWGCTETSAWGPGGDVNADAERREDGKMGMSFRSASRRRTTSPARAVISASSSAGGWRCGLEDWRVAVEEVSVGIGVGEGTKELEETRRETNNNDLQIYITPYNAERSREPTSASRPYSSPTIKRKTNRPKER